jgi:hypothetical protein
MDGTYEGKAVNAKLGAAVRCDDGSVVYLEGMAAWERGERGRRVRVTGEVSIRTGRTRNEKGEICAGYEGEAVFVRRHSVTFLG